MGSRAEVLEFDGIKWKQVGKLLSAKYGIAATMIEMDITDLSCRVVE